MSTKAELQNFVHTSSIKGLSKIAKSPKMVLRCLWIICLVFGVSIATYQCNKLLQLYLSLATTTQVKHESKDNISFPNVLICQNSPKTVDQEGNSGTVSYTDYEEFIEYLLSPVSDSEPEQIVWLQQIFGYQKLTKQQREENRIIDCDMRVGGVEVDCLDSARYANPSPYYSNCVLFSVDASQDTQEVTEMSLTLYLQDIDDNADNTDLGVAYAGSLFKKDQDGVRVYVLPSGLMSLSRILPFTSVSPGHFAIIDIKPEVYEQTPYPYSLCNQTVDYTEAEQCYGSCYQDYFLSTCGCADHISVVFSDMDFEFCDSFSYAVYTLADEQGFNGIVAKDLLDIIEAFASSRESRAKMNKTSNRTITYDFCNYLEDLQLQQLCLSLTTDDLLRVLNQSRECLFDTIEKAQDFCIEFCPDPCIDVSFTQYTSAATWPHESTHLAFYRKYLASQPFAEHFSEYERIARVMRQDRRQGFKELRKTDLIRRNFLKITCILIRDKVFVLKDIPLTDFMSIFGSACGILNLWVGISFVTLVEVIDLGFRVISAKWSTQKPEPVRVKSVGKTQEEELSDVRG